MDDEEDARQIQGQLQEVPSQVLQEGEDRVIDAIRHAAGPMVGLVQRCSRCSVVLIDYRNSFVAAGSATASKGWEVGAMVVVNGQASWVTQSSIEPRRDALRRCGMMDLSLGGPVEDVGDNPDKKHAGGCNDGVYGCSRCYDYGEDGNGTISECEWCKTPNVATKITRASDEPAYYAVCAECRRQQAKRLAEEAAELDDWFDSRSPWGDNA